MSRSKRLMDLAQLLRQRRRPVSGNSLATELGISLRTLYRDIATLQEHGAEIEGAPGVGYVLKPGFTLPPLMFSESELEALVLGMRWVSRRADADLQAQAQNALARIMAVLPPALQQSVDANTLLVVTAQDNPSCLIDQAVLRQAIREEHKITIVYRDQGNACSHRIVWPFALGYFDHVRMLAAWCELREDFRHFRLDRISAMQLETTHYPRRRAWLMRQWRQQDCTSDAGGGDC